MGASAPDPPSTSQVLLSQGDLIDGKYRVERVLGAGAMGSVVAAYHTLLDLDVAVKVLSSELLRHEKSVERFMREARAVARLKSEHVARVMDVGTLDNGQPYIVMELLEGEDLDRMLRRIGPFTAERTVDFALQALEALAHAHGAGVVHRDLKPANLFLTTSPDGREVIKVLDFGVAKLAEPAVSGSAPTSPGSLTGEHAALGSPGFMSPEQVRCSRDIDERADIWGMGVLLYEVLGGHAAFDGESIGEIFGNILHTDPRPLREHRPELPEGLEAAVMRCIRRKPEERFQSVAELASAIEQYGSGAHGDYAARIARTLARSTRMSDPARSSRPPAVRVSASTSTPPVIYTPVPPDASMRSTHVRPRDINSRETMLDAAGTQGVPVHAPRRRRGVAFGAVLALVALAGVVTLMRTSPRQNLPAAAATPATQAPEPGEPVEAIWPDPAPAPSAAPGAETAALAPASQPSASAPAAAASTPAQPVKRAPPSRHGSTGVPSKTRPGQLPSVLDSPE